MQEKEIVGLFIDGFTFKKVNEYYRFHHCRKSSIDFRGFKNWVSHMVQSKLKLKNIFLECHYYHPYECPSKNTRFQHLGTQRLESKLVEAGIQVHYNQVSPHIHFERKNTTIIRPNLSLIDDALMFSIYKKINAVVLVSTQGQFSNLLTQLKNLNIPTISLGWDFEYPSSGYTAKWHTDLQIKEKSVHYVPMEKVMENTMDNIDGVIINRMFLKNKKLSINL